MTQKQGPQGPDYNLDFWDWSQNIYAQKGVSAILLQMQDDLDMNVNLLLWSIWTAQHYGGAPAPLIKNAYAAIDVWTKEISQNLRRVRRALKKPPKAATSAANSERAQNLRKKVKKAELDAEEIEQNILQTMTEDHFTAPQTPQNKGQSVIIDAARQNLRLYFTQTGVTKMDEALHESLLEKLLENVFCIQKTDTAPNHD